MTRLVPLPLRPTYKEFLWGGTQLKTKYGKTDAPERTAESWELSTHPDGPSTVISGPYEGMTLAALGKTDKDAFWGKRCPFDTFPILVKLIDAEKVLSVQVHPSDQTADRSAGEQGKTEMWYVLDCRPQSYIYFGLSKTVSREEFRCLAVEGSVCDVLNRVPVKKGDVFYIEPGTVHAIGPGIQIAEIQQNSNTTFRIYDYGRRDANGNERPLHHDRALSVIVYDPIIPDECKANGKVVFPEFTMTELFSCRYFTALSVDVHPEILLDCDGSSFHHILCVEGNGYIEHGGAKYSLARGSSFFMPAALGKYRIAGQCRVLLTRI